MKTITNILILFILVTSIMSCTQVEAPNNTAPLAYFEALNISYGSDDKQVFDIYLPAGRTTETKVMLLVHGGGWSAGDKSEMNGFKDFLRQQTPDMAIVNINYRLADENTQPYPMQIHDITAVVNYLRDKQADYVISDAIGFIGASAGAHLSLLWSYAFDTQNKVDMVCSIVGPTNLTDPAYLNNTNPELQVLLDLYGQDASIAYLEEVSPYHQVSATAPPTILFYGGQDPLIPTTQGTAMRDKLETLGVTHQFTLYPDEGHGWLGVNLIDTTVKLKGFINTHM